MKEKTAKEIILTAIDDSPFELLNKITIEEVKEELLCTKIKLIYLDKVLKTMLNDKDIILPKHCIPIVKIIEKLASESLEDVAGLCECKIKNSETPPF